MSLLDARLPGLDVSRETQERLHHFASMLEKWSPKINLVAKSTLADGWNRHIIDSAQVFELRNKDEGFWADLGAGGGFPGLVVAILAHELAPKLKVALVESDQRKAVFLRSVLRETGVSADVKVARIEQLAPLEADILSARALADLPKLLSFSKRHLAPDGQSVFLKGATWQDEVAEARKSWNFHVVQRTSITDPNAVVLTIGELTHV
ncbi:16S rRNA (guanine(527)-N(7))-methyltransferase RsmG [Salipiger bermudensis]|uniref:16S rRNA (guanine(527)-N(7))-methyltransferase RsmG n=1 Tax=Salipiger bermudensis TaxID=344736 RepID=UPI001CD44F60|nr:16S rRNA (guanine(527)-N(7))-methyltransferase RsmG [Salipiger bermudensis]MCA0962577.1 16S rRNA (guanine(527)-N(7))-methyltransferase RsmG [Salipiger bermudensis]